MKKMRFFLALLPLFALTSCLEIVEDVSVNKKGDGQYVVKVDAGEMMNLVMTMGGDKDAAMAEKLKEVKDTTFSLLGTIKSGETATAEEMEMLKNSTIHLKMDLENSVFLMESSHTFTSVENFNKLKQVIAGFNKKADNPLAKLLGGNDENKEEGNDNPLSNLGGGIGGDAMTLVLGPSSVKRSVDSLKLAEMMKVPGMEEMDDQGKMVFEAIKYKTIFHLPSAATVTESKSATLSDDRKTVTFENNLLQLFEDPKAFLFNIRF